MASEPIFLQLQTRDPVIARDGRPFGINQGRRMRSLDWPYPSTVAGSVRTAVGKLCPGVFPKSIVAALKKLQFGGPFPTVGDQLFFPTPGDCLRNAIDERYHVVRPQSYREGEKADLPGSLLPVMLPDEVASFKFGSVPAWWSLDKMTQWLITADTIPADFFSAGNPFLESPKRDERTHVQISPETYTAAEGMLFTTVGLVLDQMVQSQGDGKSPAPPLDAKLSLRIQRDEPYEYDHFGHFAKEFDRMELQHPVGGERRLVNLERSTLADCGETSEITVPRGWTCPEELVGRLDGAQRIQMVLASPAHFEHGWRPQWLDTEDENGWRGCPPGSNIELRLIGVANQRWRAVSGWSVEKGCRGPKPIRRLVPAGAVYFFESLHPDKSPELANCWLKSVSDDPILRTEGFGLALWGIW